MTTPPGLRVTLRIDVGGRRTLGPGKVRLLELVGQHGSISGAARAMGMSYRRAWTLVESLNGDFGGKLVAAKPGGAGGGGAQLLPDGAEVVQLYRTLEAGTAEGGRDTLGRLASLLAAAPEAG